jgi:hypothetical protein
VCPCNGCTYKDLVGYQEHCLNDSEYLDTEKLECVPFTRVFALRQDYFSLLKGRPNLDGNVNIAKALLD